jgi:hypothetical protein
MIDHTVIAFTPKIKPRDLCRMNAERVAALERGAERIAADRERYLAMFYRIYEHWPMAAYECLESVIRGNGGMLPPGHVVSELGYELEECMLTGLTRFGLQRRRPGPNDVRRR